MTRSPCAVYALYQYSTDGLWCRQLPFIHQSLPSALQLVRKFRFSTEDEWLFWTDGGRSDHPARELTCVGPAIGVGVFAATGARTGQLHGATVYGCALCGMISVLSACCVAMLSCCTQATFGGLMRDVLCQRPVRIL